MFSIRSSLSVRSAYRWVRQRLQVLLHMVHMEDKVDTADMVQVDMVQVDRVQGNKDHTAVDIGHSRNNFQKRRISLPPPPVDTDRADRVECTPACSPLRRRIASRRVGRFER